MMLIQDPCDYADVFAEFELPLDPEEAVPLYPFAPVFRIPGPQQDLVLKRTCSPLERAIALAEWEHSLAAWGLPVVTPVEEVPQNPRQIGEEVWVLYPYVAGEMYEAEPEQLHAAGELLGMLHAVPGGAGLSAPDWLAPQDVHELVQQLTALPLRHAPAEAEAIVETLVGWLEEQPSRVEWLADLELPEAECSCDYKANNLVFTSLGPVLVDPDLAGRVPRLLDLALACLLFHNEIVGGQGRLLTPEEWEVFLDGYYAYVSLTDAEIAAWPEALRHIFLTHGLWLVFNEYAIESPLQQSFMDDLLSFALSPEFYSL